METWISWGMMVGAYTMALKGWVKGSIAAASAQLHACLGWVLARINGSVAAAFWAATQGARIIRTHDVRETHQVLTLAGALGADRPTPQAG